MLKKTITYKDYFGNERTEDLYFNFTKSEAVKFEHSYPGGMVAYIEKISKEMDSIKLVSLFEDLILMFYGERSEDGKRFMKSKEISNAFKETRAYDILFMEIFTDGVVAAEFINGAIEFEVPENEKMLADLKNAKN